MLPLLSPDEEILIDLEYYRSQPPQVNDIIVVKHPLQPDLKIVKRISKIVDNKCFIVGDNPQYSNDSRHFGLISQDLIIGKVICRFP